MRPVLGGRLEGLMEEVFGHVRFALMPPHVLAEEVERHPLIACSEVRGQCIRPTAPPCQPPH